MAATLEADDVKTNEGEVIDEKDQQYIDINNVREM